MENPASKASNDSARDSKRQKNTKIAAVSSTLSSTLASTPTKNQEVIDMSQMDVKLETMPVRPNTARSLLYDPEARIAARQTSEKNEGKGKDPKISGEDGSGVPDKSLCTCVTTTNHVKSGPLPDHWSELSELQWQRLDVNDFIAKMVPVQDNEFASLSKGLRQFYSQQNNVIQSFAEAERRFHGRVGDDDAISNQISTSDTIAIRISNIVNVLLFCVKTAALVLSGSVAVLSSLIDSGLDLFTGFVLWITGRRIDKSCPYMYPIGRQQLEPVAIIVCASVMCTAAFQVIVEAIRRLTGQYFQLEFGAVSIVLMSVTVVCKALLHVYCRRIPTPSAQALSTDHLNDAVSNLGSIGFALFSVHLWAPADATGAILMALYIIYNWWQQGWDQAKGLSGRSADGPFLQTLTWIAANHDPRILAVETVSAYHVGTKLLAEVDIVVSPSHPLEVAHDIAETLQLKYESLEEIERAFVHIDFEIYHDRRFEHVRHR